MIQTLPAAHRDLASRHTRHHRPQHLSAAWVRTPRLLCGHYPPDAARYPLSQAPGSGAMGGTSARPRAQSGRTSSAIARTVPGMAIARFPSIVIDCPDPGALAAFYGAMLDWKVEASPGWAEVRADYALHAVSRALNSSTSQYPRSTESKCSCRGALADTVGLVVAVGRGRRSSPADGRIGAWNSRRSSAAAA